MLDNPEKWISQSDSVLQNFLWSFIVENPDAVHEGLKTDYTPLEWHSHGKTVLNWCPAEFDKVAREHQQEAQRSKYYNQ